MQNNENNTMNSNTITSGNSIGSSSSSSSQVNSRWNPTKEQISVLENLYKEGIRTPNADQIQQITSRLRAFGHIEGKNVFYWFQNHKARQRQKQKQESLAYNIHRFFHNNAAHNLHHHQPSIVFPPPSSPNVICSPYYLPQSEFGFYPQYLKESLPLCGFKRKSISKEVGVNNIYSSEVQALPQENHTLNPNCSQETLPLFPLHPTGILQGGEKPMSSLIGSTDVISTTTYETDSSNSEVGFNEKPFFNFLTDQGFNGSH